MPTDSKRMSELVNSYEKEIIDVANQIWGFAEPRFQEFKSSKLQQEYMASKGFSIRADLAGEKTAFIAEKGSGKPVIAFLGEFDALSGLSQEADAAEHIPCGGEQGHGCGHNLLGCASMAAALGLADYAAEQNLPGTIRYYGCPAEENAGGKAYLVRDGLFNDCDIALTWHPGTTNEVRPSGSLANFRVFFTFTGLAAHAAGSPHVGRSALDAVELMDVGVNYMREHMIDAARIHYAITDAGGTAPNVVQAHAQVLYAIRAPRVTDVKELYERVCKIAQGAALMTETTVEIKQVAAYSNFIANEPINDSLYKYLNEFLPLEYTDEEKEYALKFREACNDLDKKNLQSMLTKHLGKAGMRKVIDEPMLNFLMPRVHGEQVGGGSTDVGDVSWVVPTSQIGTATWAPGTPGHAWQVVAQGKSSIAHKGMMLAARTLACAAADFLYDPELVKAARENWLAELDGETYPNPLPADCKPGNW